jgi:hypothetical protein
VRRAIATLASEDEVITLSDMERRKHRRYYFIRPCWCEGSNITMLIRIANISRGGFFLKTSNPLPIGRHAILTFKADNSNEIIAEVEVVWHSRGPQVLSRTSLSGMGTKLLDIVKGDAVFDTFFQLDK